MKKRSLISIAFAFLSVITFTVIVNLTFFGYNFINIFLSKSQVLKVTKETVLNHKMLGDIVSAALNDSYLAQQQPGNDVALVKSEDVSAFFKLAMPEEIISQISYDVVTGIYNFLESDAIYPDIQVVLAQFKKNVDTNLSEIVDLGFSALPECTPVEREQFLSLLSDDPEANINMDFYDQMPKCRPHEPFLGTLEQMVSASVREKLEKMPALIDLTKIINPSDNSSESCMQCHQHGRYVKDPHLKFITKLKGHYTKAKKLVRYIWVMPVCFLLMGMFFGASGFKSMVRWLGGPLILSGILSCVIIFYLSGDSILFNPELFCDSPAGSCPAYVMASSFGYSLFNIVNPFLHLFAIIQLVAGLLLIFIAGRMKA